MFGKKCSLCGGKVVHGICTECGLNNKKQEQYRPNQSSCDDMPLTHSHGTFEHSTTNPSSFSVDLNDIPGTIQEALGQNETTISNEEFFNQIRQEQMEMEVEDVYHRTPSQPIQRPKVRKNNPKGCFTKVVIFAVAANIIFGLIGGLIDAVVDGMDSGQEEVLTEDYNFDSEIYDFDIEDYDFSMDETELSEEAKQVVDQLNRGYIEEENTYVIGAGCYTVGVHIPVGIYNVENRWSGSIVVTDSENTHLLSEYYSDGDRGATIEEVDLDEGERILISNEGVFALIATQEITNEVKTIENPNTEVVELNKTAVAGKDFPAGVYDLSMTKDCFGIVEIFLEGADFDKDIPVCNEFVSNCNFDEEDIIASIGVKNMVIPEGATIVLDEASYTEEGDFLLLTPSNVIGSTDYDAFYENGFVLY